MRALVVHNRYRTGQPSGENAVVDEETQLLADNSVEVERLELRSDDIATWSFQKKAALPARVVWSLEGYRLTTDAIRNFRPDVVHFHNTFPLFSPSALWAAHRSCVPVVQTLHNFRPICPAATFLREGRICEDCLGRVPFPAVRHGCYRGSRVATVPLATMGTVHRLLGTWQHCVDVFISLSEFMRQKYVQAGWPASKLVVKYNTASDMGLRRDETAHRFLALSRFTPEKGIDVLLEAWASAFPNGGQQLILAGAGEEDEALRRQASQSPGVEFRGAVSRSAALELLAGSRALVVPSRCYEGFPRVIAEAYCFGVPVIASRIGALEEIVEDGLTGMLVDPGSPSALRNALVALASSDDLAGVLGRGARSVFENRFSPTVTTQRLLSIYERATASRHGLREDVG